MCILEDGTVCHLLTPLEQRIQHDFEERKEPYEPRVAALALRLETAGIMSRFEHLLRSAALRERNALRGLRYESDCPSEERNYMRGTIHVFPPVDPLLSVDMQEKVFDLIRKKRRATLDALWLKAQGRCTKERLAELRLFPEFPEFVLEKISHHSVSYMARQFNFDVDTLRELLPSAPPEAKKELAALVIGLLFNRMFHTGDEREATSDLLRAVMSASDFASLNALFARQQQVKLLRATNKVERKARRKARKLLSRDWKAWRRRVFNDYSSALIAEFLRRTEPAEAALAA